MNKKLIAIMIALLFLLVSIIIIPMVSATGLKACTDTNEIDISDIPCNALTNVINCTAGSNVSVINLNTSQQYNMTISPFGDGRYNFTFAFNTSTYSLVDCANNSATILVGDFPRDDLWKVSLLLGIIGIALILILSGLIIFESKNWMIKSLLFMSGSFIILIGINIGLTLTLLENIRTLVSVSSTSTIAFISIFVLYILIYYTIGIFRAFGQRKREFKEE